MTGIDDAGFRTLTRRISESAGLALDAYKDKCLKRRIAVRMRARGLHTYPDYQDLLERDAEELRLLTDVLTINVTKFFRNREMWERLAVLVVPAIFRRVPGEFQVWSAGCSSGEESFTLGMLFAERAAHLGHPEWFDRVTIDATDIDRLSLERSREGVYPDAAFSETAPLLVQRYAIREADGSYRIAERVRRRVRVLRQDMLLESPPAPPYQLIVCRNVIIYFDRPSQERLMEKFTSALVPGGYLVLGKVETIFGPARGALELIEPRERIYQRPA